LPSLSPRQQQVLQATVRHYVDTTEPVGSMTLVRRFGLEASSATVRSAMGALEQRGLLTQPHTSAGRIPSQAGYRVYVNELLPSPGAAASQLERELGSLGLQWAALDDLLQHLARRLADLTGLLSLITRPQPPNPQLQAVRLVASGDRLLVLLVQGQAGHSSLNLRLPAGSREQVEMLERWTNNQLQGGRIAWQQLPLELQRSGELLRRALEQHHQQAEHLKGAAIAAGLGGLLAQPEFEQSTRIRPLLQLVEEAPQQVLQAGGIWIGAEHPNNALQHCSLVQADYRSGDGSVGHVALIGPMRMAYATARSAVHSVAQVLERLLG